jgi:hypothetical protein
MKKMIQACVGALALVTLGCGQPDELPTGMEPAGALSAGLVGGTDDRLLIYNLNTKHLSSPGTSNDEGTDYKDFVYYMNHGSRPRLPDIIVLQEVNSPGYPSCASFVSFLESVTGANYACRYTNAQGGAAIVYRVDRLSYQTETMWTLYRINTSTGVCERDSGSSVWTGLAVRFKDDINGKFVNVASVHTPTVNYGPGSSEGVGDDCIWTNLKEFNAKLNGLGSAHMKVLAGDFNHRDAYVTSAGHQYFECMYKGTNVDLGGCGGTNLQFKDPMYRACSATNSTESAISSCLTTNHWTMASSDVDRRIDFLFVKAYSLTSQYTVKYDDGDAARGQSTSDAVNYSDHRGQLVLADYYGSAISW